MDNIITIGANDPISTKIQDHISKDHYIIILYKNLPSTTPSDLDIIFENIANKYKSQNLFYIIAYRAYDTYDYIDNQFGIDKNKELPMFIFYKNNKLHNHLYIGTRINDKTVVTIDNINTLIENYITKAFKINPTEHEPKSEPAKFEIKSELESEPKSESKSEPKSKSKSEPESKIKIIDDFKEFDTYIKNTNNKYIVAYIGNTSYSNIVKDAYIHLAKINNNDDLQFVTFQQPNFKYNETRIFLKDLVKNTPKSYLLDDYSRYSFIIKQMLSFVYGTAKNTSISNITTKTELDIFTQYYKHLIVKIDLLNSTSDISFYEQLVQHNNNNPELGFINLNLEDNKYSNYFPLYIFYLNNKPISLKPNNEIIDIDTDNIIKEIQGGQNKYIKTDNKITFLYNKKKYSRIIYINERKKYVKINKDFILLSKVKKI